MTGENSNFERDSIGAKSSKVWTHLVRVHPCSRPAFGLIAKSHLTGENSNFERDFIGAKSAKVLSAFGLIAKPHLTGGFWF